MPDHVTITVNGRNLRVKPGTIVSAALLAAGIPCRTSKSGQPRTAFCGMGICFECSVTVDGIPNRRTCQLLCRPGMVINTQ
ncbi:MAG TPA: (2Fe-2S)-binding protein [Acidobacteriaceae bacterium]